jgi:hypothetical protein
MKKNLTQKDSTDTDTRTYEADASDLWLRINHHSYLYLSSVIGDEHTAILIL